MESSAANAPIVTDNPDASRYELHVGGELAGLVEYRLHDGIISLTHAEVGPAFRGANLATHLARFSLDEARRRGLAVLPYCTYVSSWIRKHPEYTDLVPAASRAAFGIE